MSTVAQNTLVGHDTDVRSLVASTVATEYVQLGLAVEEVAVIASPLVVTEVHMVVLPWAQEGCERVKVGCQLEVFVGLVEIKTAPVSSEIPQ